MDAILTAPGVILAPPDDNAKVAGEAVIDTAPGVMVACIPDKVKVAGAAVTVVTMAMVACTPDKASVPGVAVIVWGAAAVNGNSAPRLAAFDHSAVSGKVGLNLRRRKYPVPKLPCAFLP